MFSRLAPRGGTMRALTIVTIVVSLGLAATSVADGGKHQVRYVGIHPIPKSEGGGICYIEGPHVHVYAADKLQYRDHRGENFFVGDPVAYGYTQQDGPRHVYKGHHPIHVDAVVGDGDPQTEWCYIDGPHYHYFAPVEGPEFKVEGDAYFYVGEPPRAYIAGRPTYMKINTVYQPLVYERPVIAVDAPHGWIGARAEFIAPGVVVAPGAAVVAPGGAIVTPGGAVVTGGVGVSVGVGVGVGGGVIVGAPPVIVRERPVIIEREHHEHHDNGRHRGWDKHR
jgi:hypothetical protein